MRIGNLRNKMNGIIITNQDIGHNAYKIRRFTEEGNKLGISLTHFINDGSLAVISNDELVIKLPKCDFVIYLDKDIYLARILEKAGYRLFNKADFIKMCDDKMLTNIMCANAGINMPKTIAGPLFYSPKLEEKNLKFLDDVSNELGYPLVMKKVYGSLGTGVFLVNSKDELKELYRTHCREPLQFQEYINTSFGKSVRVLIIDGKILGAFERYNTSDFRSNFGVTATSKPFELTNEFKELTKKISSLFDIEYAGIDFLFGENNAPVLCEINSNAFFEEFEKVTKINVAKEFMEMVRRKIYE